MDPTRTPGYEHHQPLTERLLRFLDSLREPGDIMANICHTQILAQIGLRGLARAHL
jgi:hypothetical protein